MTTLETLYSTVGSLAYFLTLVWAIFLAADHIAAWPRRAFRVWGRVRPVVHAAAAAWVVLTFTMIYGVPGELIVPGINHAVFEGLQLFAAWVGLPAALWFIALAQGAGRPSRRWWLWAGLLGAAGTLISQLAFIPFEPTMTPDAQRFFTSVGMRKAGIILGVLLAPAVEEIVFRGVIQGRLEVWAKRRRWPRFWAASIPIASASFLWTLGHVGLVQPQGLKEAQIFLLGLLFGAIRRRYGLLGAIVAHGVLNTYVCVGTLLG